MMRQVLPSATLLARPSTLLASVRNTVCKPSTVAVHTKLPGTVSTSDGYAWVRVRGRHAPKLGRALPAYTGLSAGSSPADKGS